MRPRAAAAWIAASGLVLVAVGIAYAAVARAGFLWDDHLLVEPGAAFRRVGILELVRGPFWPDAPLADAPGRYYRPVTLLSFRADDLLGGGAAVRHLHNLALHLVATWLVAFVGLRLGARRAAALGAAAFFGLAPRLTESVAWISGRTDLVAAVFGLLAFAVAPDVRPRARYRGPRSALVAVFLFLALGGKEVGVAFVVAIAIASRSRSPRLLASLGAPLLAYGILRLGAGTGLGAYRDLGVAARALTVLEALGRYVGMIVWPFAPRTSIGVVGAPSIPHALLGGVAGIGLAVAALRLRLRRPVRAALALAATGLGLVLHVLPFALGGGVAADRLLYVPLAGLALAVAQLRGRWAPRLLAAAAVVAAPVTRARVADYTDEVRFWTTASETADAHATMARSALAALVRDREEPELACALYASARTELLRPGASRPALLRAEQNLAGCWSRVGRSDEALAVARALVQRAPELGRAHLSLAFVLLQRDARAEARAAFDRAAALDPRLAPLVPTEALRARDGAGLAHARYLASEGRLPEALLAYTDLLSDPNADEEATQFVARYAPLAEVPRLLARASTARAAAAEPVVLRRERRHAEVQPFLARLRALAGE